MRNTKRIWLGSAWLGALGLTVLAAGSSAVAADLPARMAVKAAVVQPYQWTGLYAGLHAGYGWSRPDSNLSFTIFDVPTTLAAADNEEIPASYRVRSDGFVGGGQIGFNFQIQRIVLGMEADLSYSDIDGQSSVTGLVTSGGPPTTSTFTSARSQQLDWLATVRGRAGITPHDALFVYVTGGLAMGRVEDATRLSYVNVGTSIYFGTTTDTLSGWTIGAGAEYRLTDNLTAKLEYLHFDLGSTTVIGTLVGNPLNPVRTVSQFDHQGHILRVGLNYRFGPWGPN